MLGLVWKKLFSQCFASFGFFSVLASSYLWLSNQVKSAFFGTMPILTMSISPFLLIIIQLMAAGKAHGLCLASAGKIMPGLTNFPKCSLPLAPDTFGSPAAEDYDSFFLNALCTRVIILFYFLTTDLRRCYSILDTTRANVVVLLDLPTQRYYILYNLPQITIPKQLLFQRSKLSKSMGADKKEFKSNSSWPISIDFQFCYNNTALSLLQTFVCCALLYMNFRKPFLKNHQLEPPAKLIIDTHGGLQDILAIVLAYQLIKTQKTGQQIIGITCVGGKNSLDTAVRSALVANKILGAHIPIYRGQSQSLMLSRDYPKSYLDQKFAHIEEGLFASLLPDSGTSDLLQQGNAVDFLIEACKKHEGSLGIVAFGPVTNLGLAHRLEDCLNKVKMISLTGGQCTGMGNTVRGHVEGNFAHDPLAADVLFEIKQNGEYLKDKLYVNVVQNCLSFCFKEAINMCLDSGKLDPTLEDMLVNMMGINSIVVNCGPVLTILPLVVPKVVEHQYHVYGEIVMDAEPMDGLLAINWLKVGAKPGEYDSFFYLYSDYHKETINELVVEGLTAPRNWI